MPRIHADLIRDGIQGDLFYKEGTMEKGKAMIILGSSFGRYKKNAFAIAKEFARRGIPSMGLAYWKEPGLTMDIRKLPVEYIGYAVKWLRDQGFTSVGIYGISKGAEYALVAASLLPEINFAVAVSPFECVLEGSTFFGRSTNTSSWSFQGNELPWIPWNENFRSIMATSLLEGQLDARLRYRDALRYAGERSAIKVENINGPVLLITATDDTIWAANETAVRMMARLKVHHFPYKFEHINYMYGTHLMLPFTKTAAYEKMLFKNARKRPEKYLASKKHAAARVVKFVDNI